MRQGIRLPVFLIIALIPLIGSSCQLSRFRPEPTAAAQIADISTILPPTVSPLPTLTATDSPSPTDTATFTPTSTLTLTPTITLTPTRTMTSTITPTFTRTLTPTYAFPTFRTLMQAFCRYGPATAYLYAWGMYPGDTAKVWGRNASGTWLWIQPDNIKYQCWIAASVGEVTRDVMILDVAPVRLPHSTLYGPPRQVSAVRNGEQVVVSWSAVKMTEDKNRGYMIEANVCQGKTLVWMAAATMSTSLTIKDESGCSKSSNGLLYTVEKHGYTDPVQITWPS